MKIKDVAEYIHHNIRVQIFNENILLAEVLFDFVNSKTYEIYVEAEILSIGGGDYTLEIDILI